mgnify:CR=1 FL=1
MERRSMYRKILNDKENSEMKNFKNYDAEKYMDSEKFQKVEDGIYRTQNPYDESRETYVTSLTFELEPDSYGEEEGSPQYIPQTPFEDLLDEYSVAVSDFYDELNNGSEAVCYQEFMSVDIGDIRKLRLLIGKRFYAKLTKTGEYGEEYEVVIE